MDIRLTCRHYDLSEEIREYASRKAERVVKHFDGVHSVEMILSMEGGRPKAEMIVGAVRGQKCVAAETGDDVFVVVDAVVDKIDRQIKRLKGRLREQKGRGPEIPGAAGGGTET